MPEQIGTNSDFDGGVIINRCPECGQFVKAPEIYNCSYAHGATAESFCKRCNKIVPLEVIFY